MEIKKSQKAYSILGTVGTIFLLILYLIKSPELTPLGIVLAIVVLILTLSYLFGILKGNLRTALLSTQAILGIIFIFSGFVKAVDPVGSMVKIDDYLHAFSAEGLMSLSLLAAFILCSYEFPLGVSILLGAKGKLMSWLFLIIMLPFTFLTLYLAIKNPVSDCGCFGDALILTNWETFFKNIIIMFFVGFILMNRNHIKPTIKGWFGNLGVVLTSLILVLGLSIYAYIYLPPIDFRPYKAGNDIQKLMTIPEGEQGDRYESILIYKNTKSGETISLNADTDLDKIPTGDDWIFDTSITKHIKGYTPPIHDFKISNKFRNDITDSFLNQKGYRILIIQDRLEKSNIKGQQKMNKLVEELQGTNIAYWALTSSLQEEIDAYRNMYKVPYEISLADTKMIKTIVRSNPGMLLFKDNVVLKKWPSYKIPNLEALMQYVNE